ncbi:MAG: hypothetical protein KAS07_03825, partial [Candidatus Pacebacteria bacterium]|nr:hypothetical protein [Candidatus Paceibacterota bacterium]
NMDSGTTTSKEVTVLPDLESNPFQYYASSTNFSGDEYFCNSLIVSAFVGETEMYNGPLKGLVTSETTSLDIWNFTFSTVSDDPNSVCHFDIDLNGWQTRNDLPDYKGGGYKDTETVSHSIYSSGFRIQKVYFDHEAQDNSGGTIITGDAYAETSVVTIVNTNTTIIDTCCEDECDDRCEDDVIVVENNNDATIIVNASAVAISGGNTANGGDGGGVVRRGWVEIYNQTNTSLDISGWKICDDTACDTLSMDINFVEPYGFVVIVEDESSWHEWNIPGNVVVVPLSDGAIGGGLDYGSDMLFIKRPDDIIIDQMNWGEPSVTWLYYNSDVWNPGILVSTSTEILAREPLGYDTNQQENFVELELPAVDLLYPDEECDETWYWTFTYLIEWIAFNQNGEDSELLVDIFAVFDENGSGELDDGDTAQIIVSETENDGNHLWTVPEGFIGTIWIQVIARGPENPMLFSGTISGDIWDPIPQDLADSYEDEYHAQELGFKGFRVGQAPQGPPSGIKDVVNKELSEFEDVDTNTRPFSPNDRGEVISDETSPVSEGSSDQSVILDVVDESLSDPSSAEGYGVVKPSSAEGSDVVKEEDLEGVVGDNDVIEYGVEEAPVLPETEDVPPEDEEPLTEEGIVGEVTLPEQQNEGLPSDGDDTGEATLPEDTLNEEQEQKNDTDE